jgi:hypothetical protein
MPRRKRYPWVQHWVARGAGRREYIFFRKPGSPRIPLPGPYGSPEFIGAYYAALSGKPYEIGSSRTIPRSINALIAIYYASPNFKKLRPITAKVYRNILEKFREVYGDHDAAGMKSRDVRKLMDKAASPVIANRLLSLISILMKHAIKEGWRDDNPAFGVERLEHRTDGFATWGEPDIAAYRAYYPLGSRERLVLELALGTAQRRGDLVRLGWRGMSSMERF